MSEVDFDYEEDIFIDPDALDVECLEQPSLFMKYAEIKAEAKREHDQAWERAKVVRSELTKECKENEPKATAPMIEAYYRTHPDHVEAKQELIDCEFVLNMADLAISALHHRKAALENLVRLGGMEYFAMPTTPRDVGQEFVNKAKRRQANEKIKVSMKPRRKEVEKETEEPKKKKVARKRRKRGA